jgi:hypothetical protein
LLSLAALSIPARSPFSVIFRRAIRLEHDRLDECSNGVRGTRATLLVLQRQTEAANFLAIDVGHSRMQQLRHLRRFET